MLQRDWKIKIVNPGYKLTYDVYIFRNTNDGHIIVFRGDELTTVKEGEAFKPSFEMGEDMLQELANVLSEKGFKPKEGFYEAKIEATEKHLEDMRKLVFKNK